MTQEPELLLVRDVMTRAPTTLSPTTPLPEALEVLDRHGWTGAPVVDADGRLVGVFSELDGLKLLANDAFYGLPPGQVGDHLGATVHTVGPEEDIYAALGRMQTLGVRRLPVCDGAHLVGLLTASDLGKALLRIQRGRDAVRQAHPPAGASWDPEASRDRDRKRS